jgi:hypothetical protein
VKFRKKRKEKDTYCVQEVKVRNLQKKKGKETLVNVSSCQKKETKKYWKDSPCLKNKQCENKK